MKKLRKLVIFAILLFLFSVPASAHPGKTDQNGGHTDHSTGEYHYHHGYPAHDHWDMDGDGDLDCPYFFDNKTGQNSGSSSSGSGNGNYSSSDMYENGYEKGQEDGYNDGYDDGYLGGYEKGYDEGFDEGYDQAKADMEEEAKEKVQSAYISVIAGTIAVLVFVGIPVASHISEKKLADLEKKHRQEIAKIKQEKLQDSNAEVLRRIDPNSSDHVTLPDGVKLELKCTPVKGNVSASRPFGDFTAYISASGKRYHYKKECSGANTIIHVLDRPNGLSPCSVCASNDTYSTIPDWYLMLTGKERKTADSRKSSSQASSKSSSANNIQSSLIKNASYTEKGLVLEFRDGGKYLYYSAPYSVYQEFVASQSKGKYFHEKINGRYPYEQYRE